jgi:hypothetical protein
MTLFRSVGRCRYQPIRSFLSLCLLSSAPSFRPSRRSWSPSPSSCAPCALPPFCVFSSLQLELHRGLAAREVALLRARAKALRSTYTTSYVHMCSIRTSIYGRQLLCTVRICQGRGNERWEPWTGEGAGGGDRAIPRRRRRQGGSHYRADGAVRTVVLNHRGP